MPEKKGVGVIHIKPFSKSKNVAKIIDELIRRIENAK